MTSDWNYTITHYDESNSYASTVLSSWDVDSIPLKTDQGSGEVNRAIIKLNAVNGKFITQAPIIDQFDKIRIVGDDGQGGTYNRVFEVIHITPSEDTPNGTTCQIDCLGNEWYLQHLHYAKPWFRDTAFNVLKDGGDVYNSDPSTTANGGKLPDLEDHDVDYDGSTRLGNALPKHTINSYDYATSEILIYDMILDLIDRQGSSVDFGGVLDFFEIGFDTDAIDLHKIHMRAPISGADPQLGGGSLVEIDGTVGGTSVNTAVDEGEGGIAAQTATRQLSWGELGSIPDSWAKYLAEEVDFIFRPVWVTGVKYFVDSKVLHKGVHYRCILEHTSVPSDGASTLPPSKWTAITFMSEVGNVIQYSEYTDDKVNMWAHMGADPLGTPAMWDGNILINYTDQEDSTKNFFRTWAHHTTGTTGTGALANPYFYDKVVNNDTAPRSFRWLNKTPFTLSGTDEQGKNYENAVIEYKTSDGSQRIVYDVDDVGAGFQCAVFNDGKVYEWDGAVWNDVSASSTANDCFHPYSSIANIDGAQEGTKLQSNGETKTFLGTNNKSAIEVTSTFTTIKDVITGDYYKAFAGLCFGYPFPFRTDSSFSERNGSLYGSPTLGEPATFDPQNMHLTPSGLRGFNQTDSEELGNVTGLSIGCRVKYELGNTTNKDGKELLVANIPVRVTCIDSSDNKVIQDQTISFRNNWEDLYYPINGFKVDRGVVPVFKSDTISFLTRPKEQEAANVFEWRNLKLVSIQVQSFFDEWGRFNPLKEVTTGEFLNPQSQVPMFGATVKLAIDGLRWTKRNLASSGVDTERNIEAPFLQRNQVFSYNQLKKDALAEQQINAFRHREYVISTQGKYDIRLFDSFLYTNPRTVFLPVADRGNDESENTIKLVAKKIEYSMTKVKDGKGGFIRRIYGVKRFV